jgi:hypothetical protein
MCFYFFLFEKVESFRISKILSLIWSCKRLETNYLGKTIAFLFYSDQNDKWRFPTIKELEDLSTRCQKMSNFLQDDKTRSNLLSVFKRFLIFSCAISFWQRSNLQVSPARKNRRLPSLCAHFTRRVGKQCLWKQ